MAERHEKMFEMFDNLVKIVMDNAEEDVCQYFPVEVLQKLITVCMKEFGTSLTREYATRVRGYKAICLGLPKDATDEQFNAAIEELVRQCGSEEAAKVEMKRRADVHFPLKVDYSVEFSEPTKPDVLH